MEAAHAVGPVPLAVTFKQFYTTVYPCSRARATSYVATGELESFMDRGRRMVLVSKAREFVERKAIAGAGLRQGTREEKAAAGRKGRAVQKAMMAEPHEAAA